jgi:hypothetical protein
MLLLANVVVFQCACDPSWVVGRSAQTEQPPRRECVEGVIRNVPGAREISFRRFDAESSPQDRFNFETPLGSAAVLIDHPRGRPGARVEVFYVGLGGVDADRSARLRRDVDSLYEALASSCKGFPALTATAATCRRASCDAGR